MRAKMLVRGWNLCDACQMRQSLLQQVVLGREYVLLWLKGERAWALLSVLVDQLVSRMEPWWVEIESLVAR